LVEDAELALPPKATKSQTEKSPAPVEPLSDPSLDRLQSVLSWNYPQLAATQQKAKASVTELRRLAMDLDPEGEAAPLFSGTEFTSERAQTKLSAADQGIAHHKFLQNVALDFSGDLATEADRLAREAILTESERAALQLDALAQFWNSELGRTIRDHAAEVRRELAFTARLSPAEISAITGQPAPVGFTDEFVVVQGAADLVVIRPAEIWLVDFKTDHLQPAGLAAKVKRYEPQVKLYAAALEKVYNRPVTVAVLHFLAVRKTERVIGRPW
jgi:ATP-dependent helicase/nuclease subunit A